MRICINGGLLHRHVVVVVIARNELDDLNHFFIKRQKFRPSPGKTLSINFPDILVNLLEYFPI